MYSVLETFLQDRGKLRLSISLFSWLALFEQTRLCKPYRITHISIHESSFQQAEYTWFSTASTGVIPFSYKFWFIRNCQSSDGMKQPDETLNETRRPLFETGPIKTARRRIIPTKGDSLLRMVQALRELRRLLPARGLWKGRMGISLSR